MTTKPAAGSARGAVEDAGAPEAVDVTTEIGQIARGAGWGLGSNAINYILGYLFFFVVTRQIGAEQYGFYTLAVTAITLLSRFTVAGLDRGVIRYVSISRGAGQWAAMRHLILIALILGGLIGLAGGLWVWLYPAQALTLFGWSAKPELLPLLRILAITAPAVTIIGIAIASTQAFRTMRYRALVVNIIQPALRLALVLILLPLLGATAAMPVTAFTLTQLVGVVLALFFLARLIWRLAHGRAPSPPAAAQAPSLLTRNLVRFSLPLAFASVVEYLNGRTEILVLGRFLPAEAAGIFNAATRFAGLGLIVLTAFNAIFAPLISDLHHRGDVERLDVLYKLVTRWVVAFAMPVVTIQIVFAPALMQISGAEFRQGATALRLLSLGQLVNFATGSVGLLLMMSGRANLTLFNSVLTIALSLALDFWLIPMYGLTGAALVGAAVMIGINLLRLAQVWAFLRIHPFAPAFLKPFLAAAPAVAVGLAWLRWLPLNSLFDLGLACAVVAAIYAGAILLLGLDEDDRTMIRTLRLRLLRA